MNAQAAGKLPAEPIVSDRNHVAEKRKIDLCNDLATLYRQYPPLRTPGGDSVPCSTVMNFASERLLKFAGESGMFMHYSQHQWKLLLIKMGAELRYVLSAQSEEDFKIRFAAASWS